MKIFLSTAILAAAFSACGFQPYSQQELETMTDAATYRDPETGFRLQYRIYVPAIPETATNGVPLVLFLHGSGECGTNNVSQLKNGMGGLVWWSRNREPAVIVAPQAPPRALWSPVFMSANAAPPPSAGMMMPGVLKRLVDSIQASYRVDPRRRLVTGISLGGYGAWKLVVENPGFFAAGMPVCGGVDPKCAEAAAQTPLWIFHGERDGNVPNRLDRAMVGKLWELDAPVRYTEYPDSGHAIWDQVYSDDRVMGWFFSRKTPSFAPSASPR